jgi:hypothetical protein
MPGKTRDPLEPLTTTVALTAALSALLIGAGVLAAVLGTGSAFGWGSASVCVDAPRGVLRVTGEISGLGLAPDSSVFPGALSLCTERPGLGQRVGVTLTSLPEQVLFLGFLLLVHRILRVARARGLYTGDVVRQLRFLGWYLVVGALTASLVETLAIGGVLASQTSYLDWLAGANQWHPSLATIISGLALVSVSRVMRIGVVMRHDLEGTV